MGTSCASTRKISLVGSLRLESPLASKKRGTDHVDSQPTCRLGCPCNRPHRKRRSKAPKKSTITEDGPYDRRITANRRISITSLVPPEEDVLAIRKTWSGFVLTTDVASGVNVPVHQVGKRREVWLRGKDISMFLSAFLISQQSRDNQHRSVALDVYRRVLPNRGLELEMVLRGSRRSPW